MKLIGTYEPPVLREVKPYEDLPEFKINRLTTYVTIDSFGLKEWYSKPEYFGSFWGYPLGVRGDFIMNVNLEGTDPATTLREV